MSLKFSRSHTYVEAQLTATTRHSSAKSNNKWLQKQKTIKPRNSKVAKPVRELSLAKMEEELIDTICEEIYERWDSTGTDDLNREDFEHFIYIMMTEEGNRDYADHHQLTTNEWFRKSYESIDEDGSGGLDKDEFKEFLRIFSGMKNKNGEPDSEEGKGENNGENSQGGSISVSWAEQVEEIDQEDGEKKEGDDGGIKEKESKEGQTVSLTEDSMMEEDESVEGQEEDY